MRNLLILFFIFVSAKCLSTVHPGYITLEKSADLVVLGKVLSVNQVPYTGPRATNSKARSRYGNSTTQLSVEVSISKVLKGKYTNKNVIFSYSDVSSKGHMFKECIGKSKCFDFNNKLRIFYLVNQEEDERYLKLGAKGFILVDAWFGIRNVSPLYSFYLQFSRLFYGLITAFLVVYIVKFYKKTNH